MYKIAPEERRNRVLKAVIDEYSVHARPVASRMIVYKVRYSPATIRNIMAELEEVGYLKKAHPSAGRIPTDRGYRLYVDSLMEPESLTTDEEGEVEELLDDLSSDLMDKVSSFLSKISRLLGIVLSADERIFIKGRSNILGLPDFSDLNRVRRVFEFLEREEDLFRLLSKGRGKGRVSVLIGKENECSAIKECSIAMASYTAQNGRTGVLSVIGPTRMKYFRIIPAVEFISRRLTRSLNRERNESKEEGL